MESAIEVQNALHVMAKLGPWHTKNMHDLSKDEGKTLRATSQEHEPITNGTARKQTKCK